MLAMGDITKREEVLWNVTLNKVKPYLEYHERTLLFRECVIAALGGNNLPEKDPRTSEHRNACKKVNINNCETCDISKIGEIHGY